MDSVLPDVLLSFQSEVEEVAFPDFGGLLSLHGAEQLVGDVHAVAHQMPWERPGALGRAREALGRARKAPGEGQKAPERSMAKPRTALQPCRNHPEAQIRL